jgi:hypothetical protein
MCESAFGCTGEGRMLSVAVENKSISTPSLVPSISSFETQLDPLPALQLQFSLREPVTLVSAYDVKRQGEKFVELCGEFRKSSVLLLDSGGYEHSHAIRYAANRAPSWTFDDFKAVCALPIYDYVFSYDYFWCEEDDNETAEDFELRLLGELFNGHSFVAPDKLIPVLHLHAYKDDKKRLSETQLLTLVARIASECKSPFIAIPERELGDGLLERHRLTKAICAALANDTPNVGLHVLGCGNLLSFAFLAVAGARMVDGLEWYRTFVADNFHLHHFQQEPVFPSARKDTYNPVADLILTQEFPYRVKVATLNLMSLQTFSSELLPRLQERTVHELVTRFFGKMAGAELRERER